MPSIAAPSQALLLLLKLGKVVVAKGSWGTESGADILWAVRQWLPSPALLGWGGPRCHLLSWLPVVPTVEGETAQWRLWRQQDPGRCRSMGLARDPEGGPTWR